VHVINLDCYLIAVLQKCLQALIKIKVLRRLTMKNSPCSREYIIHFITSYNRWIN